MKYHDGVDVMVGDVVVTGNDKIGVVEKILSAGSDESLLYSCGDGGILIREDWSGKPGLLVTSPTSDDWEDLDFRRRRKDDDVAS
jgi:hypothetical protein